MYAGEMQTTGLRDRDKFYVCAERLSDFHGSAGQVKGGFLVELQHSPGLFAILVVPLSSVYA